MTDPRDLIQRLTEKLDHLHCHYNVPNQSALIAEAHAYLSRPEPEVPTDEPLGDLIDKWVQEAFSKKPYGCKHPTHTYVACKAFKHGRNHAARTAIDQPEPEGLTDEELLRAYGLAKRDHCYEGPIDDWPNRAERAATVHGLRAVIAADRARWGRPAIEPVPVSERLPTEADCDAEGMCWWWHPDHKEDEFTDGWMLLKPEWAGGHHDTDDSPSYTHWLPHYALPVPTQHGCTRLP